MDQRQDRGADSSSEHRTDERADERADERDPSDVRDGGDAEAAGSIAERERVARDEDDAFDD